MASNDASLKSIRVVLYVTTIFYGLVNIALQGDNTMLISSIGAGPTLAVSAAVVGTIQLLAAFIGLIWEATSLRRPKNSSQLVFLTLCLTFLYEAAIVVILSGNPFSWAPLLVYSVICAVIFLAEG